ncbi:hypothetical protein RB595_009505 [Gaeumannomyces hyphopodioides]
MAYSGYSYQDWSVPADYQPSSSTAWEWDGHRESGQHAPRRMQHGYSEETGHYVYDTGSLREDDPYRIQPRTSATRRITSGPTSHSRSGDDGYRQSDRPSGNSSSSRRRDEKEKSNAGRGSTSASGSSRGSGSRNPAAHEPSRSRGSHHCAPPRTPTIERLATPELAPLSAGLRFCSCGCSDGLHEEEERYMQGREKMDSHLQYASRHISRRSDDRRPRD